MFFTGDAFDKILNDMINKSEYCFKVIETKFHKPLAMTKKDHENFKISTRM